MGSFLCVSTRKEYTPPPKAVGCGRRICFGYGTVSGSDTGDVEAEVSKGPIILPFPSTMRPAGTSCFFNLRPEIQLKLTHKKYVKNTM